MHNCLIFGSGRSGTSMVAGLLATASYHHGNNYVRPREANPKGFFEDSVINRINERILSFNLARTALNRLCRPLPWRVRCWLGREIPPFAHWLARVPLGMTLVLPDGVEAEMQQRLRQQPFCYKDPRFSHTLPLWRPYLPGDTRFLVVFRDPRTTAKSVLREQQEGGYFTVMRLNEASVMRIWDNVYRHVFRNMDDRGRYLFVHYDRVASGAAIPAIESFLGCVVNREFPDRAVSRAGQGPAPPMLNSVRPTYERLLELESDSLGADVVGR